MADLLHELKVRKIEWVIQEVVAEGGQPLSQPARRVALLAVLDNSALRASSDEEGLRRLADTSAALAEQLMPRLTSLLGAQALSYGKAAIVGTAGHTEHAAALLHPPLGKPMRAAIGGGTALIPSTAKVAAAGSAIDVPLGHRNDPWSFDEIDTLTVSVADAPRPQEVVLVIALASSGRPHARVKKAP